MEVSADQLEQAVEGQHGGKAVLVSAEPVEETIQRKTVWEGVVHVFDLEGHPKATGAYAWSPPVEGSPSFKLGHYRSATFIDLTGERTLSIHVIALISPSVADLRQDQPRGRRTNDARARMISLASPTMKYILH